MDLFNNTTEALREEFIPSLRDWSNVLDVSTLTNLKSTLDILRGEYTNETIYPSKQEVFKIFKDVDITKIKVVILGQDCYFNGNAMGYAFGCKVNISPSLEKIITAIKLNFPVNKEREKTLQYLVNQGVFLLNTALTVRAGMPTSHINLWKNFTNDVIRKIQQRDDIIWMLWGNYAKEYKEMIKNKSNVILIDSHPAHAARNNVSWTCNHFIECNRILRERNKEEIQW